MAMDVAKAAVQFGGAVEVFSDLRSHGFVAVVSKKRNFETDLLVQWFYLAVGGEKASKL